MKTLYRVGHHPQPRETSSTNSGICAPSGRLSLIEIEFQREKAAPSVAGSSDPEEQFLPIEEELLEVTQEQQGKDEAQMGDSLEGVEDIRRIWPVPSVVASSKSLQTLIEHIEDMAQSMEEITSTLSHKEQAQVERGMVTSTRTSQRTYLGGVKWRYSHTLMMEGGAFGSSGAKTWWT
ncbi:hypothetical protein QJS10_CPB13g01123 [Acorus calamus]|uniref:Uncharacterized protein n=1 Tax=Acorus calamus TaxID=4465 RepID=A0AAV9DFR3_ACOCL|nr:hypothetical protein QJS10_CPB13g01123 [Acorus calamus]